MKVLRLSPSPRAHEEELLRKLLELGVCGPEALRLTIAGRRLFIDGFVESLQDKLETEKACREMAAGWAVVNRLRVAASEERQVS